MSATKNAANIRQLQPLFAVQNIDQSIAFYRDRLGFSLVSQAESEGNVFWCWLERGGSAVMLQQADDDEDGPPEGRGRGVTFYFICDDADAMYAELSSRGVPVAPPREAYYGMNQLFVPEPNGYTLCFESPVARTF